MRKVVQKYLPLGLRQKIYCILVFISLILLFHSVWQVTPVIVEPEAPLGLASYLTPGYWIGLALIVATSIFAFLDRELKKDATFILILIALGLFLLAIRVFIQENAQDTDSYYPTSEVFNLLATAHIDIANPPNLLTYYSWPAIHFISASLLEVTGIGLIHIMKYTPLYWVLSLVLITYAIGKRLELERNYCFLLSFLALSSWIIPFAGFYCSRLPAMTLFLLLFMLLLTPRKTASETVVTILLFSALAITHGLTALAVLPGLISLSIYKRRARFIPPFIAIFGSWYMYQASLGMETGLYSLLTPLKNIFEISQIEIYQVPSAMARYVARYSLLAFVASYAILITGSIVLLLRHKVTGTRRGQVISLFCWSGAVALLAFGSHGQDLPRSYIYSLVPVACIVTLSFSSRKLLFSLMILFVALSPFVNYGALAGFGQVFTSELKGAEFMAFKVKPQSTYFGDYSNNLALYYDPNLIKVPFVVPDYLARWPGEADLSVLDESSYVVISRAGINRLVFAWGEDPYAAWPQTETGRNADLIYNSGYFQIYENH